MNYFIVTTTYSTYMQFLRPYANRLRDIGYDVTLLCNKNGDQSLENHNVKFQNISYERQLFRLANLKALFEIRSFFKDIHGIINVHTPIAAAITRIAVLGLPIKVIYTSHGFHFHRDSSLMSWLFYFPVEWILSKLTDRIITINRQDYILSKKFFSSNKTSYISGIGFDANQFEYENINLRYELSIPKDAKIVLSVGELNHNKNHKLIIDYFIEKNSPKDVHYVICGRGPLESKLKNYCSKYKISERIHFLGYRNDIQSIMNESDVFAFPSLREGLPVSLMEAIHLEMDVIAFNIRGNEDLIPKKFHNQFLVKPYCRNEFFSLLETKLNKNNSGYHSKTSSSWVTNNHLSKVIDLYTEIITNI